MGINCGRHDIEDWKDFLIKNLDLDNKVIKSGNSAVFVYVDTTAIAYGMACSAAMIGALNSNGQVDQAQMMNTMIGSLDKVMEQEKVKRDEMIAEVKRVMNKLNEEE